MAQYKLVDHVNRHVESSTKIVLVGGRELHLNGDPVELTESEVKHLEDRFVLEEVQATQPAQKVPELRFGETSVTEKEVKQ